MPIAIDKSMGRSYRQGNIVVTDKSRQVMPAEVFLSALYIYPPSTSRDPNPEPIPSVGASLRWAVAVDQSKAILLEVQSLPTFANLLQKKFFSSDNSVSVLLGTYALCVDTTSDPGSRGLFPIFFLSSPTLHLGTDQEVPGGDQGVGGEHQRQAPPHGTSDDTGGDLASLRQEGQDGEGHACFPASCRIQKEG